MEALAFFVVIGLLRRYAGVEAVYLRWATVLYLLRKAGYEIGTVGFLASVLVCKVLKDLLRRRRPWRF